MLPSLLRGVARCAPAWRRYRALCCALRFIAVCYGNNHRGQSRGRTACGHSKPYRQKNRSHKPFSPMKEIFRLKCENLTWRIRLLHIADDGLPTIVHMDVLDADKLLPAVAQAAKDLNLGCVSPHQTSRRRSRTPQLAALFLRRRPAWREPPWRLCGTGHLDGERSPQFRPSALTSRARHSWLVLKCRPTANEPQPPH
jgi:hypothetical protein